MSFGVVFSQLLIQSVTVQCQKKGEGELGKSANSFQDGEDLGAERRPRFLRRLTWLMHALEPLFLAGYWVEAGQANVFPKYDPIYI